MKKNLRKIITAMQKLGLQPGTVLVVKVPSRADAEAAHGMFTKAKADGVLPKHHPIAIVPQEWTLLEIHRHVARKAIEAEAQAAPKSRLILPPGAGD